MNMCEPTCLAGRDVASGPAHFHVIRNLLVNEIAKLAVIGIITTRVLLQSWPNIGFSLTYFIVNFVHLELFFCTLYLF